MVSRRTGKHGCMPRRPHARTNLGADGVAYRGARRNVDQPREYRAGTIWGPPGGRYTRCGCLRYARVLWVAIWVVVRAVQHRLTSVGVKVVTVSKFACRRISECLDLDPSGIDVMYEGADHILRVPADAGTLQRHGLSPGKFALIVGAGAAHKNIAAMKEAADLLTRHGIVLAIAGASNSWISLLGGFWPKSCLAVGFRARYGQ